MVKIVNAGIIGRPNDHQGRRNGSISFLTDDCSFTQRPSETVQDVILSRLTTPQAMKPTLSDVVHVRKIHLAMKQMAGINEWYACIGKVIFRWVVLSAVAVYELSDLPKFHPC